MSLFQQAVSVLLVCSIILPGADCLDQRKKQDKYNTYTQAALDYTPAAVGAAASLATVGGVASSGLITKSLAYTGALVSALPMYFLCGSATYWVMRKCGLDSGVCEIPPSKTTIHCDFEAWCRLFTQIFHPKNMAHFLPLVTLELGINDNYGVVEEGKLYRSARYYAHKLGTYDRNEKLSCMVNLMSNIEDKKWWQDLCYESQQKNIKAVNVELPGLLLYSPEKMRSLLTLIHDESNYPMHVNCFHGKDRTGFFCTLYLLEQKGYALEAAIAQEMSYARYGHFECHLPYICAILRKWHEIRSAQGYAKDSGSIDTALAVYDSWYQEHL